MWSTFTCQPGPGIGLDHGELVDVVAVQGVGAGPHDGAGDGRADLAARLHHDVGRALRGSVSRPREAIVNHRTAVSTRRLRLGAVLAGLVEPDGLDPVRRVVQRDRADGGEGHPRLRAHDAGRVPVRGWSRGRGGGRRHGGGRGERRRGDGRRHGGGAGEASRAQAPTTSSAAAMRIRRPRTASPVMT